MTWTRRIDPLSAAEVDLHDLDSSAGELSLEEKSWWLLFNQANAFRNSLGRNANITHGDLNVPDEIAPWRDRVIVPDFTAMRAPAVPAEAPKLDPTSWSPFSYGAHFEIVRDEFTPSMNRNLLDLVAAAGLTDEEVAEFGRLQRERITRYGSRA